ncbi:DHH family phosphoesterase [Chrysiogenes arsenatis]|uniref:DHH family phosphoesterase n=1 Tax=Chrysiogenes arsenatis TaxID=309797 RepID=UPI000417FB1B|nr:DHH family phosphoesterase [Chrysiogenes arsenatis]
MSVVLYDERPQIFEALASCKTPVVISHVSPDGDTLGCGIALYHRLKRLGKSVQLLCGDTIPPEYLFLPHAGEYRQHITAGYDLVICVDSSSADRFAPFLEEVTVPIINIDHHITNSGFGTWRYVIGEAPATAILMYDMLRSMGAIDYEEAYALYTALFTDTGGFRYSSSNAESHRVAAELLEFGIDPWSVTMEIYESIPWQKVQLYRRCLASIERHKGGKVATMYITAQDLLECQATPADTDGFINYARSIQGVEVAMFVREDRVGCHKVSFRSKGLYDVSELCARFGGGGHKNAGGFTLEAGDTQAILQQVLACIDV